MQAKTQQSNKSQLSGYIQLITTVRYCVVPYMIGQSFFLLIIVTLLLIYLLIFDLFQFKNEARVK